jgi:hypothetical protein
MLITRTPKGEEAILKAKRDLPSPACQVGLSEPKTWGSDCRPSGHRCRVYVYDVLAKGLASSLRITDLQGCENISMVFQAALNNAGF